MDANELPVSLNSPFPSANPCRGVFCSRTLDMESIDVIGYDMDYTLVRYRESVWEGRAYVGVGGGVEHRQPRPNVLLPRTMTSTTTGPGGHHDWRHSHRPANALAPLAPPPPIPNHTHSSRYHYAKEVLRSYGFYVSGLTFISDLVVRGLIIDKRHGNLVKVSERGGRGEGGLRRQRSPYPHVRLTDLAMCVRRCTALAR